MLRYAVILLSVVLVALVGLAFLPERPKIQPQATINLVQPRLTLYPQQDPDAIWRFEADAANYTPTLKETTLQNISNGARYKGEEIDFTLTADAITIDSRDNLRSTQISVHLLDSDWHLDMQGRAETNQTVLIDQYNGKFEVPLLTYWGAGIGKSRDENVRMNFDLTEFSAGGPNSIGYNSFTDSLQN